jgi:hypothetical protein
MNALALDPTNVVFADDALWAGAQMSILKPTRSNPGRR